jgi:hypothetical protein
MTMAAALSRDRLAVLAGLVAPLALTVILVPFRASFPNTDAALALLLVVVAVAGNGYRLASVLAALSAPVWFDFPTASRKQAEAAAHPEFMDDQHLNPQVGPGRPVVAGDA